MNYKLIKISDRYILVNDAEKVNGDRCIHSVSFNTSVHHTDENDLSHWYKIVSEKPDLTLLNDVECDFIGRVNIEKLACQHLCYDYDLWRSFNDESSYIEVRNWVEGYKAARQSLQQYNIDDIDYAYICGINDGQAIGNKKKLRETFLQSFNNPTTWNVEVNDKLQLIKIL